MWAFELSDSREYVIVKGLVVPKGSTVSVGLVMPKFPSADSANELYKQLLGIKKRKKVIVEEEEIVPVHEDSEASSVDEDCASEDSEEVVSDDD